MKDLNCFNIKDGYYTIGLRTNDNSKKYFRVHRLVAKMFIDNLLNKEGLKIYILNLYKNNLK